MIQSKINNAFKELNISFPIDYTSSKAYIKLLICDNIKDYKNGLKNSLKIYKYFNFDTLIFKIEFVHNEEN